MRGAMTEFNRIFSAVKVYKDSVNYSLRKYADRARSVRRTGKRFSAKAN